MQSQRNGRNICGWHYGHTECLHPRFVWKFAKPEQVPLVHLTRPLLKPMVIKPSNVLLEAIGSLLFCVIMGLPCIEGAEGIVPRWHPCPFRLLHPKSKVVTPILSPKENAPLHDLDYPTFNTHRLRAEGDGRPWHNCLLSLIKGQG